jgi:hypothetical protein
MVKLAPRVQQLGVPDGYVAKGSRDHGVLLHRMRASGRPVCGRVRPPWLPQDTPAENARLCGSCIYIDFMRGLGGWRCPSGSI